MINVKNLTKWYGWKLAVHDVSFQVDPHTIVGFLGPNGAGKTTTLRILTCYLPATSGVASVAGYDVFSQSLQVRQRVGYMPEAVPLYPEMRVREYLNFRAALRGIPARERNKAVDQSIERCWLSKPEDMTRRRLEALSRGYRQRVGLADCLLHNPTVLVLDEPTIGLDPAQVREMRNLIRELGQEHTIILSSHILAEVEQVCSRIIIIAGGEIAAEGTPGELRQRVTFNRVIMELRGEPEALLAGIKAVAGAADVQASRAGNWTRLAVSGHGDADIRAELAALAGAKGWPLRELRRETGSLEDYFVQIAYAQNKRQPAQAV